jgi:regulator of cell morphogenesis and NO signaling
MTFFPHTTVGEVAAQFPATVRVFQRRKVEFCCGGHQTLAQVCRDIGTPYEILTRELEQAIRQAPARVTWADRPLSELTDHIVEAFHQPFLLELPRLRALVTRLQAHGDAHRRVLTVVGQELRRFEAALLARVKAEEDELFPLINRLESDGPCNEESPDSAPAKDHRRLRAAAERLRNAALALPRLGRVRTADAAVRPPGNQRVVFAGRGHGCALEPPAFALRATAGRLP